jgi:hypothetical protein
VITLGDGGGGVATSSQPSVGVGAGTPGLNSAQSPAAAQLSTGGAPSSGSGAAGPPRYYAPASHNSRTACGRYPYPPCH